MALLSPAAEELKSLIVESGLELLADAGMQFDLETVAYANVFREVKEKHNITITGSSVHGRIWPSQEHFRLDVVAEFYRQDPTHSPDSVNTLLALFDETLDDLEPAERTRESFRRFGIHLTRRAGLWRWVQVILLHAAASRTVDPETSAQFRELNRRQSAAESTMWAARFQEIFNRLDLAPRADIDESLGDLMVRFVKMAGRAMTGFAFAQDRDGMAPDESFMLRSPLSAEGLPWTPLSLLFYSNVMALFEQSGPGSKPKVPSPDPKNLFIPASEPRSPVPAPDTSLRRSRDDLRALLVQAGVDLIRRKGIRLTPSSLTYRAVFDQIKRTKGFTVNRSSVHKRFWENHDAFRLEILEEAADRLYVVPDGQDPVGAMPAVFAVDGAIDAHQSIEAIVQRFKERRTYDRGANGLHCRSLILKCALIGFPTDSDVRMETLGNRLRMARRRKVDLGKEIILAHLDFCRIDAKLDLGIDLDVASQTIAAVESMVSCGADFQRFWGAQDPDSFTITRIDSMGKAEDWDLESMAFYGVMKQLLQLEG